MLQGDLAGEGVIYKSWQFFRGQLAGSRAIMTRRIVVLCSLSALAGRSRVETVAGCHFYNIRVN
jgi:hypothetical protein